MQILPLVLLAAVAAFHPTVRLKPDTTATSQTTFSTKRSEPVVVRAVIDGDTIDVVTVGRVRLLGIDAPEIGRGFDTAAPFAREARDRLTTLVLHRYVRLEQESQTLDAYNRHLAYVLREDGMFVNALLVREGLARISARLPLTRLGELQQAEREARAFRRGMWGASARVPADRERDERLEVASKARDRYTAKSKPPKEPKPSGGKRRKRRPTS